MDFLAGQVHANPPIDPAAPVRVPGERAARLMAEAVEKGLVLPVDLVDSLRGHAARLRVDAAVLG